MQVCDTATGVPKGLRSFCFFASQKDEGTRPFARGSPLCVCVLPAAGASCRAHVLAPLRKLKKKYTQKITPPVSAGPILFHPLPRLDMAEPSSSTTSCSSHRPHRSTKVGGHLKQVIPSIGKLFSPFDFALGRRNVSRSHLN